MAAVEEYGLTVSVDTITPEEALAYLSHNAQHRPIKQKKVDAYIQEMVDGKWQLNGKSITFDSNGRLLNGQHRLTACSQSGVPLTILVVRGVDPSVFKKDNESD